MTPSSIPTPQDMPLIEHLKELRKRILWILVILIFGAIFTYSYSQEIFQILTKPYFDYFPKDSLIGTGPSEAFVLKLKVAIFSAFLTTSPLIFLQFWFFISPGLYPEERKMFLPFVVITTLLFLSGTVVCYYTILPFTFSFFKEQYDSVGITPQIRVSEHLSLMILALMGFGLIFETPVLAYFLGRLGILTHKTLLGGWRYAILIIFVLAGILTPTPDILTQSLFALPLFLLYGVSILILKYTARPIAEERAK